METHELTYPGRVDSPPGFIMGPGPNGKAWSVVGTTYDPAVDKSYVTVELAMEGLV